ncbi:MAG: hypothetical protein U0797_04530 [Gemmataceae bacterium]
MSPGTPHRPAAPPEEAPPPSPGWRAAALVWLVAFAGLLAVELLLFVWGALRWLAR